MARKKSKRSKFSKINPHKIAEELQRELQFAGIDPAVRTPIECDVTSLFLETISSFIKKYGPEVLPLLQILLSTLSYPQPPAEATNNATSSDNGDRIYAHQDEWGPVPSKPE
jgi:hypothetical protein